MNRNGWGWGRTVVSVFVTGYRSHTLWPSTIKYLDSSNQRLITYTDKIGQTLVPDYISRIETKQIEVWSMFSIPTTNFETFRLVVGRPRIPFSNDNSVCSPTDFGSSSTPRIKKPFNHISFRGCLIPLKSFGVCTSSILRTSLFWSLLGFEHKPRLGFVTFVPIHNFFLGSYFG